MFFCRKSNEPISLVSPPILSHFYSASPSHAAAVMCALPEVKINIGDKVGEKFTVKKKLGEGSCGQVYLVNDAKDHQLAMKVEPRYKNKDEEILKMEIYVLKRLQTSKHVCRFVMSGSTPNYSYVVMTLLGTELSDLRRRCPKRQMSHGSVLRIALQSVAALEDMHAIGFIHRDVKPTNLALGFKQKHTVFLFDFGLARQILLPDKSGKLVLREPRKRVSFRGTVRYCSLNVHLGKEQGRHDDIWSVLHSSIELATSTLPWKGMGRKEAEKVKATVKEATLLKNCPKSLTYIYQQLQKQTYQTVPPYALIKGALGKEIKKLKVLMTDPFEWDKHGSGVGAREKADDTIAKDQHAEADKGADNDTNKDVDESAASAQSDCNPDDEGNIEDTLENLPDVKDSFREMKDEKDEKKK